MYNSNDIYSGVYDPDSLNKPADQAVPSGSAGSKTTAQPTAQKKKKRKEASRHRPLFIHDERLRLFAGILFLLAAAYMLVASISFFYNAEADQSKIIHNSVIELAEQGDDIKNAAGPLGAFVSNLLFTEWLGLGSFFLIFYIGAIGATLVKLSRFRFWSLTFKCLILSITTSIVVGLVTYNSDGVIFWGGKHGRYINEFLLSTSSIWGAMAVSIALITLVVMIYLTQLTMLYMAWRRRVAAHRERMRLIEEQRNERERKMAESLQSSVTDETAQPTSETAVETDTIVGFDMSDDNTADHADDETLPIETEDPATDYIDDPCEETYNTPAATDDTPEPEETFTNPETELEIKGDDGVDMQVTVPDIEEATEIRTDIYDPTAELSRFRFPSIDLLAEHNSRTSSVDQQEQEENKDRITKTLKDYGIEISQIKATVGPTVTLYEIIPAEGVRIAKIKRLEDDIALSLAALGIRIIAPIPGKGTIGIEVPNKEPQTVSMRSIIASRKYQESNYELPMAIGSTISNEVFVADLAKMPHLLVAGATGMGKSVGLNAIITSLLYKKHPAELKFVLIDPKMVEFSLYNKLERHYIAKLPDEEDAIITDPQKVIATLNSLCVEMDNRYSLLKDAGMRSIKEYNAKFIAKQLNPEKGHRYMPYIVVIVDEFADLIMTAGKEVEMPIARIAQKARAVGIHMIIATQRPSTNVITGIIKANFPGRVAFRVTQMVDSKTILDRSGANQLIGRGDMLFSRDGVLERVQCAFVDTPEVVAICDCIAQQPGYPHPYELPEPRLEGPEAPTGNVTDRDPLFEEAARFIVGSGTASTSSLQRRYSIGYNRAGKIMDQMEAAGIVGPSNGGKPRQVLADPMTIDMLFGN